MLKAFLKSRSLNETYHGGVGSFLLTMLVTSYLQRQYKLSHAARNKQLPSKSSDRELGVSTDKIDLGRHLINFLDLYG